MKKKQNRNRLLYISFTITTIGLGLLSRQSFIPEFIYPYLGDVLYALMIFFILGFLFPKTSILKLLTGAVTLCVLIEISQLYQADWINSIRRTRLGALSLGSGFLWSDLVAYLVGALLGSGIETVLYRKLQNP